MQIAAPETEVAERGKEAGAAPLSGEVRQPQRVERDKAGRARTDGNAGQVREEMFPGARQDLPDLRRRDVPPQPESGLSRLHPGAPDVVAPREKGERAKQGVLQPHRRARVGIT